MSNIPVAIWKSSKFTIERVRTGAQSTVFRFSGPFTAQDMYSTMSPDAFRDLLESAPEDGQPTDLIFDLTEVPYMDSRGLGILVRYHVRCQSQGIRLSLVGISPRVQELFRLTKMESVLHLAEIKKSD